MSLSTTDNNTLSKQQIADTLSSRIIDKIVSKTLKTTAYTITRIKNKKASQPSTLQNNSNYIQIRNPYNTITTVIDGDFYYEM